MSARSIHLLLQLTTVLLGISAIGILTAGMMAPLEKPDAGQAPITASKPAGPSTTLPPVSSFSPLFAALLQAHDQAVNLPSASVAPAAQGLASISQLTLVGTIGNSLALIKGPDGSVGMVEPGEDVNGSPVVAIRASQVDLMVNGKLTTLKMVLPADDDTLLHTR